MFMLCVETKKSPARVFYERWKTSVFTFCQLITGNPGRAQECVEKAFLAYIRNDGNLCGRELPPELLRLALAATQESFSPVPLEYRLKTLEYQIFLLPMNLRTVFILRYVLVLPEPAISEVARIPVSEVQQVAFASLLKLRDSLPRHFYSGGLQ